MTARPTAGETVTPDHLAQPVQRFTQWCQFTHKHGLSKSPVGELVLWTDYDALLREREALWAALEAVLDKGSPWDESSSYGRSTCHYCGVVKRPHQDDCDWENARVLLTGTTARTEGK